MSGKEVAAVVIAALIALSAVYVFYSVDKPNPGYFGVTITVQIYGAIENSTVHIPASYDPDNFTAVRGETITLVVQNTDNATHGLAIPKFNLDTGAIKPNGTVTLSFRPTAAGNYTYYEPTADCGGGNCDNGQAMTGWFWVT